MRHAPQDRIVRREIAEDVIKAAEGFEGALAVRVEDKRQGPPKLHDLPSLQWLSVVTVSFITSLKLAKLKPANSHSA